MNQPIVIRIILSQANAIFEAKAAVPATTDEVIAATNAGLAGRNYVTKGGKR